MSSRLTVLKCSMMSGQCFDRSVSTSSVFWEGRKTGQEKPPPEEAAEGLRVKPIIRKAVSAPAAVGKYKAQAIVF